MNKDYDEKSIKILKGLDKIRKRLTMYIGGDRGDDSVNQLFKEVIDNAIDETIQSNTKHKEVVVRLNKDGSLTIRDYGRGIPTGMMKTESGEIRSAAYVCYTQIHAGGKFDEEAYQSSGGTNGVGAAAVSALSKWVKIESIRAKNNKNYKYTLVLDGEKILKETKDEPTNLEVGTIITFLPDFSTYFTVDCFNQSQIEELTKWRSWFTDIKFTFINDLTGVKQEFVNKNGIAGLLLELDQKQGTNKEGENIEIPYVGIYNLDYEDVETKIKIHFAFEWRADFEEEHFCCVNNTINTKNGGIQLTSFKNELLKWINTQTKNDFKQAEFCFGLKTVSNVIVPNNMLYMSDQTKTQLTTPEVKTAMSNAFKEFKLKQVDLKDIVRFIKDSAKRKATVDEAKLLSKKTKNANNRPIKNLTQCTSKDPSEKELYICEGLSASGTLKDARDNKRQSILPLRGKVANAMKKSLKAIKENEELNTLILALNCGLGENYNEDDLQYHKVIIATDADIDGSEIAVLLIGFFWVYMRKLIENGHLYVSCPPLYAVIEGNDRKYFKDEVALANYTKIHKTDDKNIRRFKGLGEMNANELHETIMDFNKRTLKQITINDAMKCQAAMELVLSDDKDNRAKRIDYVVNNLITNEDTE